MSTLLVENKNSVCVITLNRPEVYNALNVQGKIDIINAIKNANKDESVKAMVLTANGKAFCSGQDLNDRSVSPEHGPVDIGHTLETEWNPLIEAIRTSDKIVIAAIQGVCAGAGLSVALACDLKVAAPEMRFISGFAQIGLVPDAGQSFILTKHMGYSKALEFTLFGKPLSSEEMLKFDLINAIDPNPLDKAITMAEMIANLPPLSVKINKKNFQFAIESTLNSVLEREKYAQRFLGFSEDYQEGVKAFKEKRKPLFKGK